MALQSTRRNGSHEIVLRLQRLEDLFELPATDLFSEYRNWLTGIEFAINELKGYWRDGPVSVRIELPDDQVDDTSTERAKRAIERFCANRHRYNRNELRAQRRDGIGALGVGLVILLVGLLGSNYLREQATAEWIQVFVGDGLLLVTAWVGMWYPLDTLVYYGRPYRLENGVLEQLMAAEVTVVPAPDGTQESAADLMEPSTTLTRSGSAGRGQRAGRRSRRA